MAKECFPFPQEQYKDQISAYELSLQSAVATFVLDYFRSIIVSPVGNMVNRLGLPCSRLHVGIRSQQGIEWDISYTRLKLDKEGKLNFFVGVILSGNCDTISPGSHSITFKCTMWGSREYLRLDLIDRFDNFLACFLLDFSVCEGSFDPVIKKIKEEIQKIKRLGS